MTPSIIRDWDASTKALKCAVAGAVGHMRTAADDPDLSEGQLRDHLRMAATLAEQLGQGQAELMRWNRRNMIRFGWLSLMFFALVAFQIASIIRERLL
jgi:hypothetical protein